MYLEFDWPAPSAISAFQDKQNSTQSGVLSFIDELCRLHDGDIWIPDENDEFELRLGNIAQTGFPGHRGRQVAEASLRQHLQRTTLLDYIHLFVLKCIHCISATEGERVPALLGPVYMVLSQMG